MSVLAVQAAVDVGSFRLGLDLRVEPGEVLGVLGPNGAGKTTLLRAIAGLVAVSDGSIRLGDLVLDDPAAGRFVAAADRPVGLVFQDYRLFPHLSVADNVAFAARSRGVSRRASRDFAGGWLARLDLTALADRKPRQLSGGQAQRAALARSLAAGPEVLLLDEPLSALDASTRLEVRSTLREHLEQFAGPALIVTHDPLEAMVLTDRLLVLEAGAITQHGTPAEVARRPATQYVANLVGLNLYGGTLGVSSDTVVLDVGGELAVRSGHPPGRVHVVIRPSSVSLSTERPRHASPRNIWRGTVSSLELLTDRVRAQVDGAPSALVDLTPAAVADLALRPGSVVWLAVKATELDVYPQRSPAESEPIRR